MDFLFRSGTHLGRVLNRSCPPLQLPEIVGFAAAIRNFRLRRSSLEWKSNIIEQRAEAHGMCKEEKCSKGQ